MDVDNINNLGFYLMLGFEFYFMYKYMKYWLQILVILKEDEDGELSARRYFKWVNWPERLRR